MKEREMQGSSLKLLEASSDTVAMMWRSIMVLACLRMMGCWEDPPINTGSLGGQVVISGPVRGAQITVDQLRPHSVEVYQRVGEGTTDPDGRFSIERTGEASGLFRIVARGGSFEDLATGATVQLDSTDELRTIISFELLEESSDALVSPVGHLVEARAMATLGAFGGDFDSSVEAARASLHRHFGNADWSKLALADLGKPQLSPTAPVRAAFLQAALSYLVREIGDAANASPQQLNVYTLVQRWTADLAPMNALDLAPFDGNDGNDNSSGTGLQLGLCEPVPAGCAAPPATCTTGSCRTLCDIYVGTARALLAGAITRVIRDDVNKTGLRIEDLLTVARDVAGNTDPALFGESCVENLDRVPPVLTWDDASPVEEAVVRGVITLRAVGIDDVDLQAQTRTEILGYVDADGDTTNNIAVAHIDTSGIPDGGLVVRARANDLAGNSAVIERRVVVDNTVPQLSLSTAGYFVDDAASTWWTASSAPTLTGTLIDEHPASVRAMINGVATVGTIAGNTWNVELPEEALDEVGAEVAIRITDLAGNTAELVQRIRLDSTRPTLTFPSSTVTDEVSEVPMFANDESPIHSHNGMPIDLSAAGACPTITKYSYLLGGASPPYVTETPARNPIAYKLVSADDGVGVIDGSTQFRVLRRGAGGPTVLRDWSSAGAGSPIGGGAKLFDIAIVAELVNGLSTTEATYDVEFRATDRLSRTTTETRCFDLRLRAPPLHFGTGGFAVGHTLALNSLSLAPGAPFDAIAARLLNSNATGASLIDQPLSNGTTESVFLTVSVTKPAEITATQAFQIHNYSSTTTVNLDCGLEPDTNPACDPPESFPSQGYSSALTAVSDTSPTIPVKLYELNAAGVPTTEIPCLGSCNPSATQFTFAVPPRLPGGAAARRFVAMTLVGQVSNLWPSDGNQPASAPFSDSSINGVRYTGKLQFSSTGCTKRTSNFARCIERTSRSQYRALTYAKLAFTGDTIAAYATAPTALLPPKPAVSPVARAAGIEWETLEGALP